MDAMRQQDTTPGLQDPQGLQDPGDGLPELDAAAVLQDDASLDEGGVRELGDEPDVEAMARIFGEAEGLADHDADEIPAEDGTSEADDAGERQSGEPMWDEMSEDDKRKGFLRLQDYTKKTQDLGKQRRALEDQRQQLIQLQQQLLSRQPEQQQAAAQQLQQAPPLPAPTMKLSECTDDEGYLDLTKMQQFMQDHDAALVARMKQEFVDPLAAEWTATKQTEADKAGMAEIAKLREQHAQMVRAFPHYRDEDVQRRIVGYMQAQNVRDFKAAYAAMFPEQYADAVIRFRELRRQKTQPTTQQKRPTLAPARRMGDKEAPPQDENARLAAMTKELIKGGLREFGDR